MDLGAPILRNQRVRGFSNPVMQEFVNFVGVKNETRAHRFPEIRVDLLFRSMVDDHESGDVRAVSKAGHLFERLPGIGRHPSQPLEHELDHVVEAAARTSAMSHCQIPE